MRVSVIVSTYNRPDYLSKVLEGYLRQSRPPDEIVVADDGSGPETRAVVDDFAGRAPFPVVHVWQEDEGFRLARIRNLASLRSSGDYLIFTDGDCVPSRHFIADHARLADPRSFVLGERISVRQAAVADFTGRETPGELLKLWLRGCLRRVMFFRLLHLPGTWWKGFKQVVARGCNTALFRDNLLRVNGWDERYEGWGPEDADLVIRLQGAGVKRRLAVCSAVVFHLDHAKQERDSLEQNRRLREAAWTAPISCVNGLAKKPPASPSTSA